MTKKRVIKQEYLPTKLPYVGTCFWTFILYHFQAPGYVWGILGTLAVIAWIALIYAIWIEEDASLNHLLREEDS